MALSQQSSRGDVITDYVFAKDKIFAYMTLDDAELASTNRSTTSSTPECPSRRGVYLQASPDILMERIKLRDAIREGHAAQYVTD